MNDERIREFLADSLKLWCVEGAVEAGNGSVVAVIRANDGTTVSVERTAVHPSTSQRYAQGERNPFRWLVRSPRPRPCTSIAGVLNAVRSALGVERGEPIRVTPAPVHPSTSLSPRSGRTE